MPYLNLDLNFQEHPKSRRLKALTGDEFLIVRLWLYIGKVRPETGRLENHSDEEIEALIDWKGTKKAAIEALLKVGFIRRKKGGIECVDWREHEGHLLAFSRRGKVAARARWNKLSNKHASSIAKPILSNAPTKPTIPTIPTKPITEKATAAKSPPFIQPTLEQVKSYCVERRNGVDSAKWWDFYASKGWMVGRNKMKDWQAAVRTWERDGAEPKPAPEKPLRERCQRCRDDWNWVVGNSANGKTKLCKNCLNQEDIDQERNLEAKA